MCFCFLEKVGFGDRAHSWGAGKPLCPPNKSRVVRTGLLFCVFESCAVFIQLKHPPYNLEHVSSHCNLESPCIENASLLYVISFWHMSLSLFIWVYPVLRKLKSVLVTQVLKVCIYCRNKSTQVGGLWITAVLS